QGRFVAVQRDFLDPATIPQGTFLTITGELTGSMTLPLDETDYTYPVIDIKSFRTWIPSQDSTMSRIRPYPYYSPFWHPYWGPYGRFPYYW
ncbi:MAG: Slp family lipoprotein, partial [Nitrospira sp.]|nr:Slp family lipoprotein [Nitrospira sp.]